MTTEHDHCWHMTSAMIASGDGKHYSETQHTCCWCGQFKRERADYTPRSPVKHGPWVDVPIVFTGIGERPD
jgi:hypothetical protein